MVVYVVCVFKWCTNGSSNDTCVYVSMCECHLRMSSDVPLVVAAYCTHISRCQHGSTIYRKWCVCACTLQVHINTQTYKYTHNHTITITQSQSHNCTHLQTHNYANTSSQKLRTSGITQTSNTSHLSTVFFFLIFFILFYFFYFFFFQWWVGSDVTADVTINAPHGSLLSDISRIS